MESIETIFNVNVVLYRGWANSLLSKMSFGFLLFLRVKIILMRLALRALKLLQPIIETHWVL